MSKIFKILFSAIILCGVVITGVSFWSIKTIKNAPSEQSSGEPEIAVFSMRGLSKGVMLAEAKKANIISKCDDSNYLCDLADPVVAGKHSLSNYVSFENGQFKGLGAGFPYQDFDDIVSGVSSAYGTACRIENRIYQNAFSAKFESREYFWCFQDGELQLSERSQEQVDESWLGFSFFKKPKAKVKYTPKTI